MQGFGEESCKSGKLVMIRHGTSMFNKNHQFTGWLDPDLAPQGIKDAEDCGELLRTMPDMTFSQAFASALHRAQLTLKLVLEHSGQSDVPVEIDAALNERDYGELNGLDKDAAIQTYGKEKVEYWRRSYAGCPPGGESLKMTAQRCIPFLQEKVMPLVMDGQNVILSAHGNSLRALIMYLMEYSSDQILKTEVGWCEPIIVTFDELGRVASLHCVPRPDSESRSHLPQKAAIVQSSVEGKISKLPTYFPVYDLAPIRLSANQRLKRTFTSAEQFRSRSPGSVLSRTSTDDVAVRQRGQSLTHHWPTISDDELAQAEADDLSNLFSNHSLDHRPI